MINKLSFKELLAIARSMEEDGYSFYNNASEKTEDSELSKFFKSLANWELKHIEVINKLEADVSGMSRIDVRDPMSEVDDYIHAVVKGSIFKFGDSAEKKVDEISTPKELFNYACELEKKSILFYTGFKQAVSEETGKIVEKLIKEETRHFTFLNNKISELV